MRIGWIGLGRMGRPMVENLIRKGFDVTVQNRSQGKVQEIVAMGATAGESYAAMGATLDAVHVCLPGEDVVREVIAGPSGVLSNAREGLIIVDHSTIHPDDARDLARMASEKGVTYLDAPVSGAGPYAERGELTIMCGGDPVAFAAAKPAMDAMGRTVELMGDVGAGSATKIVNNVLMATNLAVAMEGLLLAVKAGLDPEAFFSVVRTASGASRTWERNIPRILKREYGKDGAVCADLERSGRSARDGRGVQHGPTHLRSVTPVLAQRGRGRPRRGGSIARYDGARGAPRHIRDGGVRGGARLIKPTLVRASFMPRVSGHTP